MWQGLLGTLVALLAIGSALAQDCGTSAVGFRIMHLADRVVAVWYPTTASPARYPYTATFSGMVALDAPPSTACGRPVPLVVFSHGNTGCGLQAIAFTEELARHGYVVAAPDHADAFVCHTARPPVLPPRRPDQPDFSRLEMWSDATFEGRREDIEGPSMGCCRTPNSSASSMRRTSERRVIRSAVTQSSAWPADGPVGSIRESARCSGCPPT
jgi:hypothetical protein